MMSAVLLIEGLASFAGTAEVGIPGPHNHKATSTSILDALPTSYRHVVVGAFVVITDGNNSVPGFNV